MHSARWVVSVCGATGAAIGIAALSGWWLDIETLRQGAPSAPPTTPLTAILLILLGIATAAAYPTGASEREARSGPLVRGAGIAAAAGGVWALAAYALGWPPTVELLLFRSSVERLGGAYPGRPSPQTAIAVLVIGVALVLATSPHTKVRRLADPVGVFGFLVPVIILVGYAFNSQSLYALPWAPLTGMSPLTLAALLILGVGFWTLRGTTGPGATDRQVWIGLVVLAGVLLLVDFVTAPFILFPITFVVPVCIAALRLGIGPGIGFAVALSVLRFILVLSFRSAAVPVGASVVNVLIRTGVLVALAVLISRLRLQRERARRGESQFGQLFELSPEAMLMADRRGTIRMANRRAEELFGWSRGELERRSLDAVLTERAWNEAQTGPAWRWSPPLLPTTSVTVECQAVRKGGVEFPAEIRLSALRSGDEELVAAAVRDVSERRRVERMLRAGLEERETLLREVHHRVKNNLATISSLFYLEAGQVEDEHVRRLLEESRNRVRSMALVHETLYQGESLSRADFSAYIQVLCQQLQETYGRAGNVTLRTELDHLNLDIEAAVPCGLIVNELVTNAFTHAFPDQRSGQIVVRLRENAGRCLVEVRDDGVGIPTDLDVQAGKSLGLRLVRILSRQLRGDFALRREGAATVALLRFPCAPPAS